MYVASENYNWIFVSFETEEVKSWSNAFRDKRHSVDMEIDQISTNEYRLLILAALFLIIASIISSSHDISPGLAGNIIVFLCYIFFLGVFFYIFRRFGLLKKPAIAFGILYMLFGIGFIRDATGMINFPSSYNYPAASVSTLVLTGDLVGYIIGSFTLLFILPQILNRDWFLRILVAISTLSIIIGLPAYVIEDYAIAGVNIDTYTALEPLRQYDIFIPALASFWGDANAMSKMAVAGLVGSHYLYTHRKSTFRILLIALNGFGLFLANSKMGLIAVIVSYSVYFVYVSLGKKVTTVYLAISGAVGSIFFLMILAGIGTETINTKVGFSGRTELWEAAVFTFFRHPFIGVGIHNVGEVISAYTSVGSLAPQNSYLRIFVAGGVIGGMSYIGIIISAVFGYLQKSYSKGDILTLCLLISFLLIQFTDTADPFGINKNSLILTTTLGYMLKTTYNE